jgi:hypothetical protein
MDIKTILSGQLDWIKDTRMSQSIYTLQYKGGPPVIDILLEQQHKNKKLDLNTTLPVLRNTSIGWIWEGEH